jgi:hypothetical protein
MHNRAILVALAAVAVVVLGTGCGDSAASHAAPPDMPAESIAPMRMPSLEAMGNLPAAAEVARENDAVGDALENPRPQAWDGEADAFLLAWAEALLKRDEENRPLPQRWTARELARGLAPATASALVQGRLEDVASRESAGREEPWQWLLIALEDGQYAFALQPRASVGLVIGDQIQVVGRYLGKLTAPVAEGGSARVPLIAARAVTMLGGVSKNHDLLSLKELDEFHVGRLSLPEGLYDELDDERPFLETRPYYYMLGQVKLDASTPGFFDEIASANNMANEIHQQPPEHRGEPFTVTGHVIHSFEDTQVAQDRPFEVGRVLRIMLWSSDWGPISETINGQVETKNKSVRRLFELAVISDQSAPEPGETIAASGRFLKFRAIPVAADRHRDQTNEVMRQSDKLYAMLFVCPAFTVVKPEAEVVPWLIIAVSAGAAILVTGVLLWANSKKPGAVGKRKKITRGGGQNQNQDQN